MCFLVGEVPLYALRDVGFRVERLRFRVCGLGQRVEGCHGIPNIQGYLAHKEMTPPRTLQ